MNEAAAAVKGKTKLSVHASFLPCRPVKTLTPLDTVHPYLTMYIKIYSNTISQQTEMKLKILKLSVHLHNKLFEF